MGQRLKRNGLPPPALPALLLFPTFRQLGVSFPFPVMSLSRVPLSTAVSRLQGVYSEASLVIGIQLCRHHISDGGVTGEGKPPFP